MKKAIILFVSGLLTGLALAMWKKRTTVAIGLYLMILTVSSFCVVNWVWPEKNDGVTQNFKARHWHQVALEVTGDSLQKVYKAQDALARWQTVGPAQLSQADRD